MAKIADVIKYEGDNSTFIWKHPMEDFNGLTQLIVHESQEAVFFMNGQALDLFGPGRYTLETQNIPLIGKILNRATDDKTPFHCEVYFINKTEQMAIKWGTDSKVQYIEPTYGFPIYIGASGEMSLKVNDSRKLLVKLVGTENYLNRDTLVSFFRSFLMTRVKTYIAQVMKNNAINIFEIDENITLFSESIKKLLVNDFSDYGMNLERFNLNLQKGYTYLSPIFTLGKYYKEDDKFLIPLSIQVHHAICDGFHVCQFLNELRDLINK